MNSNTKNKNDAPTPPAPTEVLIWILLAIATLATFYFLLREPEDGIATTLDRSMSQARILALAASVLGAVPGLWRIFRRGGEPNLFAMAVLFHLILASYWTLRFTLVPA